MQVLYLDGYKGIRYNIKNADDDFHIYNTRQDPGEINNLAGSNDYFIKLQQRMKDKVLQVRRPNESAPRPYDEIPVPAFNLVDEVNSGIHYHAFEVATAWTPSIASLLNQPAKSGISKNFNLNVRTKENNFVIGYSGLLEVQQTGVYTFFLQAGNGALLRLHDATVIDADKGYKPGSVVSENINLEKGYHPVSLVYAHGKDGEPALQLQWAGPGFSRQPLENQQLFHLTRK